MMVIHQEEILLEILSRLPAKSIGQFRCVSKSWNSLLSEPHFIQTHINRFKSKCEEGMAFLMTDYGLYCAQLRYVRHLFDKVTVVATKLTFDDYPYLSDDTRKGRVLACCDGLVLVQIEYGIPIEIEIENEMYYKHMVEKLLLINPTTKEIIELPDLDYASPPFSTRYGIGYDSISDDYKVVILWCQSICFNIDEVIIDVYSVNNGTWKRAGIFHFEHAAYIVFSMGVSVEGHIHWLARNKDSSSSVILAFDLGKQKFHEVPPASSIDVKDVCFHRLDVFRGWLSMYPPLGRSCDIDIWVMKEYNVEKSWTKFTIHDSKRYIDSEKSIEPLFLLGKDQLVLLKNSWEPWNTMDDFVMYNLEDGSYKDIVVEGVLEKYEFIVGCTFIESLVSPHTLT